MRRLFLTRVIVAWTASTLQLQQAGIGDWRHYAGDAGSSKYSPLEQISAANVKGLQVASRWNSADHGAATADPQLMPGSYEDTPLMADGVLYTITGLGVIVAIDPTTGKTLW